LNDVNGRTVEAQAYFRDKSYILGDFPLIEANVRLGRFTSARDALSQATLRLHAIKPAANASPDSKSIFSELAAQFWFVQGLYAEKNGRKMDALVDYRNALAFYPPRRRQRDRREEVMTSAERLWKKLGGTGQGWNDWAAQSSLAGFYGGSGGSAAWSKLADASPDLTFTDALGNRWNPQDLAKKTTFVTLWASWCMGCRLELTYLEKLYEHFRGRNDIAILALNVDDDPKAMTKALQELKVSVPSIAASNFVYSIVPEEGLPASWIITPGKTEEFQGDATSRETWLKSAVTAVDKATGPK
jgi:thiol-disulfide isomerase/thioredoxin